MDMPTWGGQQQPQQGRNLVSRARASRLACAPCARCTLLCAPVNWARAPCMRGISNTRVHCMQGPAPFSHIVAKMVAFCRFCCSWLCAALCTCTGTGTCQGKWKVVEHGRALAASCTTDNGRAVAQSDWNVDDVTRFIETTCRSKFGNDKCDYYKRLVVENDVDGEVSLAIFVAQHHFFV